MREKTIKYSVSRGGSATRNGFGNGMGADVQPILAEIVDAGSLPVGAVTLSIRMNLAGGNLPRRLITLYPALDHDEIVQGDVVVIRLKNPLGPKERVRVVMWFFFMYPSGSVPPQPQQPVLEQAYVDSEVGAATLVASLENTSQPPSVK